MDGDIVGKLVIAQIIENDKGTVLYSSHASFKRMIWRLTVFVGVCV